MLGDETTVCDDAKPLSSVDAKSKVGGSAKGDELSPRASESKEDFVLVDERLGNGDEMSRIHQKPTDPPDSLVCPVTLLLFKDPVVASSGITYERSAIEELLSTPNPLCPTTRAPLTPHLVPNVMARSLAREWAETHANPCAS